MIKLKEWVITKLIIEVTNEWTPYDWEVSFGIYNKKWEVIRQKEVDSVWGTVELSLPKIKENDYRFTLETDEGYSDIQDLIVSKSIREAKGELQRKYQIDINNQWDAKYEKNIGKNKILMNEFYMNNGNRIKKLESDIEESKGKMDMDKWELMESMSGHRKELDEKIESSSKEVKQQVEWVNKELANFKDYSVSKFNEIDVDLENVKKELNTKIDWTTQSINTINKTIWDISKNNEQNGLSISEKITTIENKIPSGWILDYEVDDEWLSAMILWSSEKIDKRIRWEVGRQKKYVSYQNMFDTIEVSGQDSLQPSSPLDALTIVWDGIDITTDRETNTLTFTGLASSYEVTQASHWFVAIDWLYFDDADSTYKKALADDEATLWMRHVVEVVDANTFKIAKDWVHTIANGLAVWEYVLSASVAWGYTQTLPWTIWDLVLYWMEVISATEISFYSVPAIRVWATINWAWTANEIAYWTDTDTLGSVSWVTATELWYLDWVTSSIQTQLNGKQSITDYSNSFLLMWW